MKLAIIFEVPDDQADTYAGVAARMIKHHQFAKEHEIAHWSFDMQMRPVAGALIPSAVLTDMREAADALAVLLTS